MQISTPKGKGKEKEAPASTTTLASKPLEDTALMKAVKDRLVLSYRARMHLPY